MSKNVLLVVAVVIVAVLAFGVAGYAYAQTPTPGAGPQAGSGYGPGMMGGRSARMGGARMGGRMMAADGTEGPLHDYMINALAAKLGLSASDLEARITAGETPVQIAQAKGLAAAQVQDLFSQAHADALKAAVAAGVITQAQADWMGGRMGGMGQYGGMGAGPRSGKAGGFGPGMRWNNTPSQPAK